MNIVYKFSLGQEVTIIELGLKGRVMSLWTGRRGNEVEVRFCANAKYENIYFLEEELRGEE